MENELVKIDDPMLKEQSDLETKKFKIASAYDFLFPEVDTYYENLLENYQFKKDEGAVKKIKQAFIEVSEELREGQFSAKGKQPKAALASELDSTLAHAKQEFLNKMEALVEGKKMAVEFESVDPDTGDVKEKFKVEFIPEWRNQRFLVKEIIPSDEAHDAKALFQFVPGKTVPLNPLRRDWEEETPSLY